MPTKFWLNLECSTCGKALEARSGCGCIYVNPCPVCVLGFISNPAWTTMLKAEAKADVEMAEAKAKKRWKFWPARKKKVSYFGP